MYWAAHKDDNPMALYVLLLHVVPPVAFELPAIFVNRLLEIDNFRLLSLAVLLPTAWKIYQQKDNSKNKSLKIYDRLLWMFFALQIILLMPYDDLTNTLRRTVMFMLDVMLVFYTASRTCINREKIVEVIATFILVCALFVPLAAFETFKGWLLYSGLGEVWNTRPLGGYLYRDGSLRALVSTGHSLILGYFFAVSFGFWLYLSTYLKSPTKSICGAIYIWIGLIAALSRGPWLTAVVVLLIYIFENPNGIKKLAKALIISLPVVSILLISPLGPKILDKLPFVGSVDSNNIDYRQRLAESSWDLIKMNPYFGDTFFMSKMEALRQGEGIVDMVNVYASIALMYGGVGLFLFIAPLLIAIARTWKLLRNYSKVNIDLSLLGASLFACLMGTVFFIATASFYLGISKIYYLLIGLAAAYGQLKQATTNQKSN
jgi:hypothetical protein